MTLVYEAMASAFRREGTTVVFNIMGDANKMWLVAMDAFAEVTVVNTRHEGAAMAMADGFARVTGAVGVCSVTYATGVTQIVTQLAIAAMHHTPVVVLAGATPAELRQMGGHLDLDVASIVRATGALPWEVRSARTAVEDVHLAFHRARTESRPVVLLAPADVLEMDAPSSPAAPLDTRAELPVASPDAIAAAAAIVEASERPVVLAGTGVAGKGRDDVLELARAAGALTATTLPVKGLLDGDPFDLGVAGSFATARSRRYLRDADCLVALGASLSAYTVDDWTLFDGARIVQVCDAPRGLAGGTRAPHLVLRCDAGSAARALAARLAGGPERWRRAATERHLAADWRVAEIAENPVRVPHATTDPRALLTALDAVIPDDAIVVIGAGHFTSFAVRYLTNRGGGRTFVTVIDFATIGQAVPVGIGAALASPDRPVVVIEGDASFMMNVQELETAARYGASLVVYVLNDGALGAEYHKLRGAGVDPRLSIMATPDLATLAESFGCVGRRIERIEDVAGPATAAGEATVVDCPIARI